MACSYFATVENRVAILEPSNNVQLENQMICELMNIAECQDVEMRRFQAMQMWVQRYPSLRIVNKLPEYFDSLISKAKNYQPRFKFGIVNIIKSDNDFFYKAFKSESPSQIGLGQSELESSYVCLNSTQLRVDCHMKQLPEQKVTFSRFIFNFFLPKGSNPPSLRFSFDSSTREHG